MNSKSLPTGYQIHNYRIEQVLGEGGFGITYKAVDLNLNRPVAIKEFMPEGIAVRSDDGDVEPVHADCEKIYHDGLISFVKEAQALARFEHNNIVKVYTFLRHHNTAYIIMEYVDGMTFSEWLRLHPAPAESELIAIASPILAGLHELHKLDLLHRDIKPGNIYICSDNRPILLDFGAVGDLLPSDRTKELSVVKLTEGYAPPEQYGKSGQGPWTDIYSLGACLHLAVTGKMVTNAMERTTQVFGGNEDPQPHLKEVPLLNNYSDHFLEAIELAISLNPKDRIEDALKLKNRLENIESANTREFAKASEKRLLDAEKPDSADTEHTGNSEELAKTSFSPKLTDTADDIPTIVRSPAGETADSQRERFTATNSNLSSLATSESTSASKASASGKIKKGLAVFAVILLLALGAKLLLTSRQAQDDDVSGEKAQIAALLETVSENVEKAKSLGVQDIESFDLSEFSVAENDIDSLRGKFKALTSLAAELETDIKTNVRSYLIGSSPQEIDDALEMCMQYSNDCTREWYEDELAREVILSPFMLDKSEITYGEFSQYAEAAGVETLAQTRGFSYTIDPSKNFAVARNDGVYWKNAYGVDVEADNQPVVHVSRADAMAYCESVGKRLPSEGEWEFVARGSSRFKYPTGDTWDASKVNWGGAQSSMLPVNSFQANDSGFFDLAGSVTEWTSTDSSEDSIAILKGGSRFDTNIANLRLPVRRLEHTDYSGEDVGFRCVSSVDEWPEEFLK